MKRPKKGRGNKTETFRTKQARRMLKALRDDLVANDPLWLGSGTVDKLLLAIEQARRDMTRELDLYFAKRLAISPFGARQMREVNLRLKGAYKQINRLGRIAAKDKKSLANEATTAARADLLRQYEIVRGHLVLAPSVTPINLQSAEQMARKGFVFDQFAESAERYSGWFRGRIENELMLASIRNKTIQEAANDLYTRLPGAFADGRYWAERLVRHEMMNSYGAAHHAYYKELTVQEPGWKMRWDAARDNRTCPICQSLHNQIIDGAPKDAAFLAEWDQSKRLADGSSTVVRKTLRTQRPPAHVQCRCSAWPWREEFDRYIDLNQ